MEDVEIIRSQLYEIKSVTLSSLIMHKTHDNYNSDCCIDGNQNNKVSYNVFLYNKWELGVTST